MFTQIFLSLRHLPLFTLYCIVHSKRQPFLSISGLNRTSIHYGGDQAPLDSKNYIGLLLGRVDMVLKLNNFQLVYFNRSNC